jgi:hypothetical protein
VPEMLVSTTPLAHPRDEKAGILNITSECLISPHDAVSTKQ